MVIFIQILDSLSNWIRQWQTDPSKRRTFILLSVNQHKRINVAVSLKNTNIFVIFVRHQVKLLTFFFLKSCRARHSYHKTSFAHFYRYYTTIVNFFTFFSFLKKLRKNIKSYFCTEATLTLLAFETGKEAWLHPF